jgi:hypothetical protein
MSFFSRWCREEPAAVRIGADQKSSLEDPAQYLGSAEAAAGGKAIERVNGGLEFVAGRFETDSFHETGVGLAYLVAEHAGEVPNAHGRCGGQHR